MAENNIKKGIGVGFGAIIGIVSFMVLIIVIAAASGGSKTDKQSSTSSSSTTNTNTTTPSPQQPKGKVVVKSEQLQKGSYGLRSIVGEVINNAPDKATFVKVTATYYDKDNNVTGTDFTYAGDTADTPLETGKTSPFKITIIDGNMTVDHYKLDVVWN